MRIAVMERVAVTAVQSPQDLTKQLAPSGKSRAYPDHRKNSKKTAPGKPSRFFVAAGLASEKRRQKSWRTRPGYRKRFRFQDATVVFYVE
jgi:hypothetical protein